MIRKCRSGRGPLAVSALVATLVSLGALAPAAQPDRLDVPALLTLYARGDFDRAVGVVARASREQAQVFQARLVSAGHAWAHDAPDQLASRLFAAAAFALEIEALRTERGEWPETRSLACNGRCVLEWACTILRARGRADDAERVWHLAVIALAGGVRDWTFLVSLTSTQRPETGHLVHAGLRLPGEPRIRLARAVALASRYDIMTEMDLPRAGVRTEPSMAPLPVIRVMGGRGGSPADRRVQQLEYSLLQLRELIDDPVVGAEARLRLGYLHLRSGEYEAAIEAERIAAAATPDLSLQYVAHFIAAQASQAAGDLAAAEKSYARALGVRPKSQSATLALAALRMLDGDPATAYVLVEQSRADRRADDDPWRMFLYGDFTRLPGLIQQLRAAVRP